MGELFVVESKERKKRPWWIWDGLMQAVIRTFADQVGLLIIHFTGEKYDDDLVVMRLKDFEECFGKLSARKG